MSIFHFSYFNFQYQQTSSVCSLALKRQSIFASCELKIANSKGGSLWQV